MAAETGFSIDGKIHELPTRDSFDLDEWRIMYEYTDLGMADFLPPAEDADEAEISERRLRFKNPAVLMAMLHIAYRREHPEFAADQIREAVGRMKGWQVLIDLADQEDDDEIPPAQTSEPQSSSPTSSLENDSSSEHGNEKPANGSSRSSDGPGDHPRLTTVGRSATSSISEQEISAA